MLGFICTKIGCSSIVEDNNRFCVSILKVHSGCVVCKTSFSEGKSIIKVGFSLENLRCKKPQLCSFSEDSAFKYNVFREYSVIDNHITLLSKGIKYDINILKSLSDKISHPSYKVVCYSTIGKGFAGVVKRYNFSGGNRSHGDSLSERSGGSTGQQNSERVFKGKFMHGRMGGRRCSVRNVKLVDFDILNSCVILKGSVPGCKNSLMTIYC